MSDNRVEIKFEHRFSRQSANGKAFKWLKENLSSACDDAITNVVRLVYLPIALAEAGASRQEVETEVQKAREFLNAKMMAALGSCCEGEGNRLVASNGTIPERPRSAHPLGVVLAAPDNSNPFNGASISSVAAIEPDDDFVELDENKFMEG